MLPVGKGNLAGSLRTCSHRCDHSFALWWHLRAWWYYMTCIWYLLPFSLPKKHWSFCLWLESSPRGRSWRNISLHPCWRPRFEAFLTRQDFELVLAELKPHCGNFQGSLSHTWDLCEHSKRSIWVETSAASVSQFPNLLPLTHPRRSWTPGCQGYDSPPSSLA